MKNNLEPRRKDILDANGRMKRESAGVESDGTMTPARRSFIKRMGLTLGAFPLAATGFSGVSNASGRADHDEDVSIETVDIQGSDRRDIIRNARRTDEFRSVGRELRVSRNASEVIEYDVEIDGERVTGYRVTFGERPDGNAAVGAGSSFINVFLSDTFNSGAKAIGKEEVDGGIRLMTSNTGGILEMATGKATSVAEEVFDDDRSNSLIDTTGDSLKTEEAVLGYPDSEMEAGSILFVPVERDGKIVDRVIAELKSPFSGPTVEELHVSGDIGVLSHRSCDPTGNICTNWCTILCGALAGLSGAACFSKCAGTIGGIPISPGCAGICAAVVGGTCRETCKEQVH